MINLLVILVGLLAVTQVRHAIAIRGRQPSVSRSTCDLREAQCRCTTNPKSRVIGVSASVVTRFFVFLLSGQSIGNATVDPFSLGNALVEIVHASPRASSWKHFPTVRDLLNSMSGVLDLVTDHDPQRVFDCAVKECAMIMVTRPKSLDCRVAPHRGKSVWGWNMREHQSAFIDVFVPHSWHDDGTKWDVLKVRWPWQ